MAQYINYGGPQVTVDRLGWVPGSEWILHGCDFGCDSDVNFRCEDYYTVDYTILYCRLTVTLKFCMDVTLDVIFACKFFSDVILHVIF